MPDTKSPQTEEPTGSKSGGPKNMIVAAALSVALLGAGYFVGGMSAGGDSTAVAEASNDEETAEEVGEEVELGELVDLEAINVNLQDGHFLRIAIALDTHTEDSGGHGESEEFPTAPAADLVLSTFSGRVMSELSTTEGREAARAELFDGLLEIYGEEISGVYLTEFVMQ